MPETTGETSGRVRGKERVKSKVLVKEEKDDGRMGGWDGMRGK